MNYQELKESLKRQIQERMDCGRDYTDDEVEEGIDEILTGTGEIVCYTVEERRQLKKEIFDSIRRLDVLQEFLDDPGVTEIMVNGMGCLFVEREGRLAEQKAQFESMERLQDVVQRIAAGCNRVVNESSPIVDARLSDGSRVNIVLNPVALNGPIITIRRFPEHPVTSDQLIRFGSVSEEAISFLKKLVQAKYNIFISGGTGSGKTTFLNVLSGFIPSDERVITIEDSAELQIQGIPNLVRLETRNGNVAGCQEVGIRDLIRASLRMRPDRIIVGEVRGAEAIDMLQAMNTGHDGSLSTGHANSARDMLSRLCNMVMTGMDIPLSAIREQIAAGIDIIVHLGRLRDKSRKVLEISELEGCSEDEICLRQLYVFEEKGQDENGKIIGTLEKKDELKNQYKLRAAGL